MPCPPRNGNGERLAQLFSFQMVRIEESEFAGRKVQLDAIMLQTVHAQNGRVTVPIYRGDSFADPQLCAAQIKFRRFVSCSGDLLNRQKFMLFRPETYPQFWVQRFV